MFTKILIANRGEVALRIIRACRELNIRTVIVYSEADRDSLPVKMADEAICIGKASASESYLNIPSIISAAEITDVEAIHPGYGFLAENAHFAEICESCQITFIGPRPENIRLMGDKTEAKKAMRKAGLPVIPGSIEVVKEKAEVLKIAEKVKYPVIIKAAAGGGGKGMRIAHNDVRLVSAMITAQAEAEAAFGNSNLYIEKYIERPRHIEFQILADKYGNVVHLGERDCTIQRRHQKLIEESPSPALDKKLRKKIGELAVKGAKAVNFSNAGTIEFLLDEDNKFYFMEMNTRIQVEHPVTETIYGIDLIKEQIRLSAGEKLKLSQDDIRPNGCAIECRINAEDPEKDFMPSPGKIEKCILPGGPNLRIDTHIFQGYTVVPFYDSLLAKIISFGKNRQQAIRTMHRALGELIIEPIKTTTDFHKKIMELPEFLRGRYTTDFVNSLIEKEKKI